MLTEPHDDPRADERRRMVESQLAARGVRDPAVLAAMTAVPRHRFGSRDRIDPWFDRHIFPNAAFPSLGRLTDAMEELLVPEDVQNLGEHYDPTLMAWHRNVEAAWPRLEARYGARFRRMWTYYLLASAATFRSRFLQLFQIVFTRQGTPQPPGARAG